MCGCIKKSCDVKESSPPSREQKEKTIRQYPPITQKVVAVSSIHMRDKSVTLRYKA